MSNNVIFSDECSLEIEISTLCFRKVVQSSTLLSWCELRPHVVSVDIYCAHALLQKMLIDAQYDCKTLHVQVNGGGLSLNSNA